MAFTFPHAPVADHEVTENFEALRGFVNASLPPLAPTAQAGTYTAAARDAVIATGTFTVTSPARTAGTVFGVFNKGTGVITVTAAAGVIRGAGFLATGQQSVILYIPGQSVVLITDGTDWYMTGGEPTGASDRYPVNLVPNPDIEVSAAGWIASGVGALNAGATLTRVTTNSVIGTAGLQVVTTAGSSSQGAAILCPGTFRSAVPYLVSCYIQGNAGNEPLNLGAADNTAGDFQSAPIFTTTTAWQRAWFIYKPGGDRTAFYVYTATTGAVAVTYFIDAVQVSLI